MKTTELTESAATTTSAPTPTPTVDFDALAASLATATPSAGRLDELEFESLSPDGLIEALIAWEKQTRHAQAGLIRALGALARGADDEGWPVETEVCVALAWAPATADYRLDEAEALTRLFPDTLQLLSEARVSVEQARALVQLTSGLDDQVAQAVEARVLPRMAGQTAAVTRQAIRRAIVRADPQAATKRHEHQRERRRVELIPENDGMATLNFYLPADIAQMAMRTLTALAHNAKRKNPSDPRTLDQRRADLLPAVLYSAATGGTFGGSKPQIPAHVNVVVGIETLLNLSHEPGHLNGYGPICPDQTRRIAYANAARWRFLLTSSDGTLVDASSHTYAPGAALKRLVELKHTACAFPYCHMPAERCDIDHNLAHHKGGPTAEANLAPLCRRHHNHKSFGHWDLRRDGDNIHWTSAHTGRDYTTAATRYLPTPTTE